MNGDFVKGMLRLQCGRRMQAIPISTGSGASDSVERSRTVDETGRGPFFRHDARLAKVFAVGRFGCNRLSTPLSWR